jgi:hypothetical protein
MVFDNEIQHAHDPLRELRMVWEELRSDSIKP